MNRTPRTRRWIAADPVVAGVLWMLAFMVGASYMRAFYRAGGVGDFGQQEFGAAVALACGRGFVNFGYDASAQYAKFLNREADTFSCDDLPSTTPLDLNFTQRIYRYLMTAAALNWSITGVSWSRLWPLFGALYASVITVAYGLFRTIVGRTLAVFACLALTVSAVHLGHLPYLRDYAKAPFMIGLVLIMARTAIGPATLRRLVACGAAFGAVLGLGFGFRNDLLIHVPPYIAIVLLCLPGSLSANLAPKAAALGAAALAFAIVASPITRAYGGGSNTGHVAVLGLTTPYDRTLGIRPSVYDWGYAYVDQYAANIVTSYATPANAPQVEYLSKDYDRAAIRYFLVIARHWPADIVTRVYASIINILELPFTSGKWAATIPFGVTSSWALRVYDWQAWALFRFLAGCGVIVTAIALLGVSVRSPWAATALLLLLIYYAGYPAIQFGARHFFHLEFIGWGALALAVQQVYALASALVRRDSSRAVARWRPSAAYAAMFAVSVIAVMFGSLSTLRAYQDPHVRSMLGGYLAAPRERIATRAINFEEKVFLALPDLWSVAGGESERQPIRVRYVIAELAQSNSCDVVRLPVTFKYQAKDRPGDFSRTIAVSLQPGEPTHVLFTAYYNEAWSSFSGPAGSHFDGLELPRGRAECLAGLYRMSDPLRNPLPIDVTYAPGWQRTRLVQTLELESPPATDRPEFYTEPPHLMLTARAVAGGVEPIVDDPGARAAIVAALPNAAWAVKGRPISARTPLVRFTPRTVAAKSVLIARGELRRGRVSFAFTAGSPATTVVSVDRPGPFVVALEAPSDGSYGAALSTDITPWWPANRVGRRLGPWVDWIPGATLQIDLVVNRIGWAVVGDPAISKNEASIGHHQN